MKINLQFFGGRGAGAGSTSGGGSSSVGRIEASSSANANSGKANFTSSDANAIMNTGIETRTTRSNPRTQAALEKSESLSALQTAMNNARPGTTIGFERGNGNVEIFEKVQTNSGGATGWVRTTLHNDGGVSWGGGYPSDATPSFVSTINTIRSVTTPITQANMDRYRRFRQNTEIYERP